MVSVYIPNLAPDAEDKKKAYFDTCYDRLFVSITRKALRKHTHPLYLKGSKRLKHGEDNFIMSRCYYP